jgi:hypothetical protein
MQVFPSENWKNYTTQRNYVTKLKRKSLNQYFVERCVGGPKSGPQSSLFVK